MYIMNNAIGLNEAVIGDIKGKDSHIIQEENAQLSNAVCECNIQYNVTCIAQLMKLQSINQWKKRQTDSKLLEQVSNFHFRFIN